MEVFAADNPRLVDHFRAYGWVLTEDLDVDEVALLKRWVEDVARTVDSPGEILHYRELTDFGPKLCRTENFVPVHRELRELLTIRLAAVASRLIGEDAVLYKEKINYKLAGGAGFSPHQDAPAYPFIDTHVSCMVAVDDATPDNGCLEVVSACHDEVLPLDDRGCIRSEVVTQLRWEPVPLLAGQTLWFHSRTPHRSGANRSLTDRRALFPTYNAACEGDLRARYYAEKLSILASNLSADRVTLSLIGDFEGRPVD